MKDRYLKAIQGQRKGDYMLQPADTTGSKPNLLSPPSQDGDHNDDINVPEFDSSYQYKTKNITSGMKQLGPDMNVVDEVAYKEELLLLQSGNFVMTAPSLATELKSSQNYTGNRDDIIEAREQASNEAYKEEYQLLETGDYVLTAPSLAGGGNTTTTRHHNEKRDGPLDESSLVRGQSKSVDDEDNQGIEKTYTTYVNVAEDQIYPLEWKFFLEATSDANGNEVVTKKKQKKVPRSASALRTILPSAPQPVKSTDNTISTKEQPSTKMEEKDSESLNSGETKRFRLFPNLRDVASRRTKRIESARQRQKKMEGNRDRKVVSSTVTKTNIAPKQETITVIPAVTSTPTRSNTTIATEPTKITTDVSVGIKEPTKQTLNVQPEQVKSQSMQIVGLAPPSSSSSTPPPLNQDVSLYELAERILGTEMTKTEKVAYDFTKSKRTKKKKKKTLEATGFVSSTSFPVMSSNAFTWESPTSAVSHEDEVKVHNDAAMNDVSDTVTIARGVEAVYDEANEVKEIIVTVEEGVSAPDTTESSNKPKLPNDNSLSDNAGVAGTLFALSRSFDDVYNILMVKSIRDAIDNPDTPVVDVEDPNKESKWYSFGRKQKYQTTTDRSTEMESKDMVPPDTSTTAPLLETDIIINDAHEDERVDDGDENGQTLESVNSMLNDNNNEIMSVMTEQSDKIVSNFFASFGELVSLIGRRFKRTITCTPNNTDAVNKVNKVGKAGKRKKEERPNVVNVRESPSNPSPIEQKVDNIEDKINNPSTVHEPDNALTTEDGVQQLHRNKEDSLTAIDSAKPEYIMKDENLGQREQQPAPLVVTMSTVHSKGSSISMTSRASTKTYETDNTDDSYDEDGVTAASSWDDPGERQWLCTCT